MDPQLLLAQFEALGSRLDRIESRQDAMTSTLIEQTRIAAEQQQILRDHTRRSTTNEESQRTLESYVRTATEKLDARLKELEDEKKAKRLVVKWIVAAGAVVGAATAIIKFILPLVGSLQGLTP